MAKKMRSWLNQNSALVTIGAVMLLVLALAAILLQLRTPSFDPNTAVWFYDLNTDELFAAPSRELPPIDSPTDGTSADPNPDIPAGVRAYVFSCTDCDDPAARSIMRLETYPPDVKEKIVEMMNNPDAAQRFQGEMQDPSAMSTLIRSPDSDEWVTQYSEQGMAIQQQAAAAQRCPDGSPPQWCQPD